MSAALSYESLEDMPEGMRRLVEKQLAKKAEREATQGNVHCGATTPQSAAAERATARVAPTALTRGAMTGRFRQADYTACLFCAYVQS